VKNTAWPLNQGWVPYAEKADKRFFFEQDVIDYLWSHRKGVEMAE
jgi:hypothetical protein